MFGTYAEEVVCNFEESVTRYDVIEGPRNILGVTQMEIIGAGADPINRRLIDVPIEG